MPSIFGPLVASWDVEAAAIATVRTWLRTYLAEVERQASLNSGALRRPPTPESICGGFDFESWQEDLLPMVIVVVKPTGEPERSGSAGYNQCFEVAIGAVVTDEDETSVRRLGAYYGLAIAGAIVQNGALGGIATRTLMVASPDVALVDDDVRVTAQAVAVFHVYVEPTITDQGGPGVPDPQESPQYPGDPEAPFGDWPTVRSTQATVSAVPITEGAP